MKKRYTEKQIAFALRQAEMGTPVAEIVRKMGISKQTYYRRRQKYGGMATDRAARQPHPILS
jgi:putative transposase